VTNPGNSLRNQRAGYGSYISFRAGTAFYAGRSLVHAEYQVPSSGAQQRNNGAV